MLTYSLRADHPLPLYEQLCRNLRDDILSGRLSAGERLPSKRSFSENLGISSITVENAYNRLIDEGYVYSEPKRGYFVSELAERPDPSSAVAPVIHIPPEQPSDLLDLSGNHASAENFPFSVWAHLLRETINDVGDALLLSSPCGGVRVLRDAIAAHLHSFRGMQVSPDQIIVGAGTEYLYGLLIQLLGTDQVYCLEDPGYRKIAQIYEAYGANCCWAKMDAFGISLSELEKSCANVVHISPTHHFPTGITMPAARRAELLAWAKSRENRIIIEDDYDSEFRLTGRPIPSLQSIDQSGRVIYINTFSKTLATTIRISYMVLPPALADRYYERMSFYSCTVSSFEQYTLARFITDGYFEKHINRMRLFYARLRRQLLQCIVNSAVADSVAVLEQDSGLHFLLRIHTEKTDEVLRRLLLDRHIHLLPLSVYYRNPSDAPEHTFIVNYSTLTVEDFQKALHILSELL